MTQISHQHKKHTPFASKKDGDTPTHLFHFITVLESVQVLLNGCRLPFQEFDSINICCIHIHAKAIDFIFNI